ncbi:MAG: hypothetical protein M1817_001142 [Caeruleum heppii]|nr:MAG: hypothetical protein M1817_001142 [Caeruleum heppii]
MSIQQLDMISPVATVLPDPPEDQVFTDEQWQTLLAIADTVVCNIRRSSEAHSSSQLALADAEYDQYVSEIRNSVTSPPDQAVLEQFLTESPTTTEAFRRELHRTLACHVRADAKKGVSLILSTINTRLGGLVFNGTTKPFHEHDLQARTAILQAWSQSYVAPIRIVSRALELLTKSTWVRTSPTIGPVLGFPRAPVHGQPGKGFDFKFLTCPSGCGAEVFETDVVIVGSGCGAGVVAKNLAEDGHRVLTVEKAYHYGPEHMPMSELDASHHLFHGGGLQPSDDNSMTVIAGSTWGGGGTVNWSASLQTEGFVRKEWAEAGLGHFTSAEFQDSLDRVCKRMGVSTEHIEHNHANRVLMEGARRLGYAHKAVPQNTGGNKHYCGYCTLGCGSAEKQGPVVSFLPDAARAGAQFMEGLEVESVIFDDSKGSKTAIGVRGKWTSRDGKSSRDVVVKSKRVVISSGTLFSPLILLRSGLKNPQIGRNLKLHPVQFIFGIWPDEIRPWEGGILTSVCNEFQNLDGHGHGAKLEVMVMLPGWILPILPGLAADYKKSLLKFKHMSGFFSIVRDSGSGQIYPDATSGQPRIAYSPSALDRQYCLEGMLALAKICYVTGASEIHTVVDGIAPYIRADHPPVTDDEGLDAGINHPAFQSWLATLRAAGLNQPSTKFGSAHQMGSCRMGVSPRTSVVNPRGQVWDTKDLYVADASVFPSASGVNPMVTNMAIADGISRGLSRELKKEQEGTVGSGVAQRSVL